MVEISFVFTIIVIVLIDFNTSRLCCLLLPLWIIWLCTLLNACLCNCCLLLVERLLFAVDSFLMFDLFDDLLVLDLVLCIRW